MENTTNNNRKTSSLFHYVYLYLAIPVVLFLMAWLKPAISIPVVIAFTLSLYFSLNNNIKPDLSLLKNKKIDFILIILIALLWVYFSGIGGFTFQNTDHPYRNAIFDLLIEKEWPVIVNFADQDNCLTYYFAIWLPSAIVGKIYGHGAGYLFLYIWCSIGVFFTLLFLTTKSSIRPIYTVLLFVLFSGLDIVGDFLLNNSHDYLFFCDKHIEWVFRYFQFSSFTTQLFWVFNQAIPAWLITLMILELKDNKSILFLYSLSFLACTLPAMGMVPLLACLTIKNCIDNKLFVKSWFKNIFIYFKSFISFQNITGLVLTLISYLFLSGNKAGVASNAFNLPGAFILYIGFILFEIIIYYFLIYEKNKKDYLYWCSLISLLAIPWIRVGMSADFCMRASIPYLIILFILVIKDLYRHLENRNNIKLAILLFVILIGSFTPIHEFIRTFKKTIIYNSMGITDMNQSIDICNEKCINFWGLKDKSIFFKYLGKND